MSDQTTDIAAFGTGTSTIPATCDHVATMIFLHGFGETAETSWLQTILPLSKQVPGIKWVFPQAPMISSTFDNDEILPAWFNTPNLDFLSPNADDIDNQDLGVEYLLSLVNNEVGEGKKVFVGGYSQGGDIALLTTLIGGGKVDGLAVVKGWVARSEIIRQELRDGYQSIPIFWAAGKEDDVVAPTITNRSLKLVKGFGMNVLPFEDSNYIKEGIVFKYYGGEGEGHAVGPEELKDLVEWLEQAIVS